MLTRNSKRIIQPISTPSPEDTAALCDAINQAKIYDFHNQEVVSVLLLPMSSSSSVVGKRNYFQPEPERDRSAQLVPGRAARRKLLIQFFMLCLKFPKQGINFPFVLRHILFQILLDSSAYKFKFDPISEMVSGSLQKFYPFERADGPLPRPMTSNNSLILENL